VLKCTTVAKLLAAADWSHLTASQRLYNSLWIAWTQLHDTCCQCCL